MSGRKRRSFRLPSGSDREHDDIRDEIAFHIEQKARRLIADGWDEEDAWREARRRFGDVEEVRAAMGRERARRTARGWWDVTRRHMSYALRALRRSPRFAVIVVLTIALGIGVNAAVFGLVDRVLLSPPPYEDPQELVLVWATLGASRDRVPVSGPDAAAVDEAAVSLAALAWTSRPFDGALAGEVDETPEHVVIARVTANFFDVFGATFAQGRGFAGDEATASTTADAPVPTTVVISHATWRRLFGGDPTLPGRVARLDGRPVVVAGVAPAGFRLELPPSVGIGTNVDVWIPLRLPLGAVARADGRLVDQDTDNTGAVVARLAPGATLVRAQSDLDRIAADLRSEAPGYCSGLLRIDGSSSP